MKQRKDKRNTYLLYPPEKLLELRHTGDHVFDESKNPYVHRHLLHLARGIYVMEEYWKSQNLKVIYRITDYNQYYLYGLKELEAAVRLFHQIVAPHQEIENKTLVFGVGATQILHASIYAITMLHARANSNDQFVIATPLYFTNQVPSYLDTKTILESLSELGAKWIRLKDSASIANENLVEVITSPNNPDGKLSKPVTKAKYQIHDRVNLWPFYLLNDKLFEKETLADDTISIFSLSKIFSFSGSRVGYAFVTDPRIAHFMRHFIITTTHGIAIDGQIRFLTALRYLLKKNKTHEFLQFITEQYQHRWNMIKAAFVKTELELLNESGPNIWLKAPTNAEKYLLQHYRIEGTYGPEYGVDETFARLNLSCTKSEFHELIWRLTAQRAKAA